MLDDSGWDGPQEISDLTSWLRRSRSGLYPGGSWRDHQGWREKKLPGQQLESHPRVQENCCFENFPPSLFWLGWKVLLCCPSEKDLTGFHLVDFAHQVCNKPLPFHFLLPCSQYGVGMAEPLFQSPFL